MVKALCEKHHYRTVSYCPEPWVLCGMGRTQTRYHWVYRIKEMYWVTMSWGDIKEEVDFKLELGNGLKRLKTFHYQRLTKVKSLKKAPIRHV